MADYKKYEQLKTEFTEWLLLDKHQRVIAQLPSSELEWAKLKQISDRTLRTWKVDPEFMERLKVRQNQVGLKLPGATAKYDGVSGEEKTDDSDYAIIKIKLIERAAAGDKSALDTYFKTYGKAYVDEENALKRSDFREIDTDEIYKRVLKLIPVERLKEELILREQDAV